MSTAMPPARPAAPPMPSLAGSGAPPFRLPGEHFAASLALWVLGALGLVWIAPDLARGLFPLPRVVATTHLFTLGWITLSILGALYQFLPVALYQPIRSIRLAHLSFALYVPGVAAFVAGLLLGVHPLVLAGAGLFATALLLFLGNLAATLQRVEKRDLTWWSLAGAGVFLLVTIALGLMLATNLRTGILGAGRFPVLAIHLHIAIAGWVFLVIVGVARHLLPMFLLSHGASLLPGKLAGGLIGAGCAMLALAHHGFPMVAIWVPAALIAAGVVSFLVQAALFFRHRRKPKLDPGMRLAGVALGFVAAALLLAGPALRAGAAAPRLMVGYVALLVLAISLFVAAHYYKILPFLVWYHRFGPLVGKRPVPMVAELYAARTASAAAALLALGAAGVVAAVLAGAPALARGAASLYLAGAVTEALQMIAIARRRPE